MTSLDDITTLKKGQEIATFKRKIADLNCFHYEASPPLTSQFKHKLLVYFLELKAEVHTHTAKVCHYKILTAD